MGNSQARDEMTVAVDRVFSQNWRRHRTRLDDTEFALLLPPRASHQREEILAPPSYASLKRPRANSVKGCSRRP